MGRGHLAVVECLLKSSADCDRCDNKEGTPLYYAIKQPNRANGSWTEIVTVLVRARACLLSVAEALQDNTKASVSSNDSQVDATSSKEPASLHTATTNGNSKATNIESASPADATAISDGYIG